MANLFNKETDNFKNIVSDRIDCRNAPSAFVPVYEVNCNNQRRSKFTLIPFQTAQECFDERIIKG